MCFLEAQVAGKGNAFVTGGSTLGLARWLAQRAMR
jgi:hypothetical protein